MSSSIDSSAARPVNGEPVGKLLGRLLDDATALARNEVALAKAEVREAVSEFKVGLASLAVAGVVLLAGVLSLTAGVIIALSQIMEGWLAAVLVGSVLAAVGIGLCLSARRNLTSPHAQLDHTQDSLQKDATVVAGRTP